MTKEQILKNQIEKFKNQITGNESGSMNFDRLFDKALNCGCIDVESIEENDYMIAKSLFAAMLLSLAEQYRPVSHKGRKELKNIQFFI